MKLSILSILSVLFLCQIDLLAQTSEKRYNSMSFFYIDNSGDAILKPLSNEVKMLINEKVRSYSNLSDNFFYALCCNGSKSKFFEDASSLSQSDNLDKYLSRASNDANYANDKLEIRDHFILFPVKIKQEIAIYYFLSSAALERIISNIDLLPTPVVFTNELLSYTNESKLMDIKVVYMIDKTIFENPEKFNEQKIRSIFNFCSNELLNSQIKSEIEFQ